MNQNKPTITRRTFVKTSAAALVASAAHPHLLPAAESPASNKMIGLQIGAVSFVDEGVEQTLDILQARGAVNTICLTTFKIGRASCRERV